MNEPTLIIRADANTAIGNGHVMRCLALAQYAIENGYHVTYICHTSLPDALRQRLHDEGISVDVYEQSAGTADDAKYTISLCQQKNTIALILDGYHFDSSYQQAIQQADIPLLVVDDNGHLDHYHADWILNQNIHADDTLYPARDENTQLLLGTQYALIRKEFWQWRGWQRDIPERAENLLVTMGGGDPDNVTLDVLKALPDVMNIHAMTIRVIIGGSNPHREQIEQYIQAQDLAIEALYNVTDMPALMAWSDVAISAGGSTNWELCMMGVPTIVIITADNQEGLVNELARQNVIQSLGWHHQVRSQAIANTLTIITNKTHREQLSSKAKNIVDGYGTRRTLSVIIGKGI